MLSDSYKKKHRNGFRPEIEPILEEKHEESGNTTKENTYDVSLVRTKE